MRRRLDALRTRVACGVEVWFARVRFAARFTGLRARLRAGIQRTSGSFAAATGAAARIT
jgi:hypothetical protein